ncbi:MAG: hypothetical protein AB7D28_10865 [Candidatus Berkiella sp.]
MMKYYRLFMKSFLLACLFLFLTGFALTQKDTPIGNEPDGNPDPNVGIVVKQNSTAFDILADSSHKTHFQAMKLDDKNIRFMTTPIDLKPHKFTLEDNEVGFVADEVYFVSISFNEKTHIWDSINFTPYFIPANWKTEEELLPYLEKWQDLMRKAHWVSMSTKKSGFHMIPRPDIDSSFYITYDMWILENKYKAYIQVERNTSRPRNDNLSIPKYNIRFYIDNLQQTIRLEDVHLWK